MCYPLSASCAMAYLDEILVFNSTVNNKNLSYLWQALLVFAKPELAFEKTLWSLGNKHYLKKKN